MQLQAAVPNNLREYDTYVSVRFCNTPKLSIVSCSTSPPLTLHHPTVVVRAKKKQIWHENWQRYVIYWTYVKKKEKWKKKPKNAYRCSRHCGAWYRTWLYKIFYNNSEKLVQLALGCSGVKLRSSALLIISFTTMTTTTTLPKYIRLAWQWRRCIIRTITNASEGMRGGVLAR